VPLTIDHIKINELKHAPNLPDVVEELLSFLEEEKKKRKDFLENLHDDTKAEFIEGEIVLNSPAKRKHYLIVGSLFKLLSVYVSINKLGEVATEKVLIHLTRNDFEPDIVFFDNEKVYSFEKNTMLHPAPNFVVEVLSESTAKYDRGVKFEDYANHGVEEYWIIDPDKEEVEQYVLNNNKQFELQTKSNSGKIVSAAVKGFNIPIEAIFSEEENIKALKNLL
jgi:Uma2 family endonuclease